jgi:hypothetical protein
MALKVSSPPPVHLHPHSRVTQLALMEAPRLVSLKPSFDWLPDHMPHHKKDVLNFVVWPEVKIMVLL